MPVFAARIALSQRRRRAMRCSTRFRSAIPIAAPIAPISPIGAELLRRFSDLTIDGTVRVAFIDDRHARAELAAIIVEATDLIVGDPKCRPTAPAGSAPAATKSPRTATA